jgi:hypothetical protein
LLTQIVAILRPLVLEQHGLTLGARPTDAGLELIVLDSYEPVGLDGASFSYFKVVAGDDDEPAMVVTKGFRDAYEAERLTLDLERITEPDRGRRR